VAQIDFSPIGDLFNTYRQAQMQSARQNSPLLAPYGGDMGLAALAMRQQQDQRDFKFREQEATRAQGNTDRNFALTKQQAEEAARGFDYREVDDPQNPGSKMLARIEKATGKITKPEIEGAPTTPNNPFMSAGKMNESQAKDAHYAGRMLAAEKVLREIDAKIATDPIEKFRGVVSDKVGYNIRSSEYQKFDQAQRDFINAALRPESGAVISESEFDNARKQYFPMPGDTAETVAQKRANRLEKIKGTAAGAGPGFRPTLTIGADGAIVDNPKPQSRTAAPSAPPDAAIQALRGNPALRNAFDQKYGAGSAARALGSP